MIVTISNLYGAGAVAIATEAARRLGYALVDRQLPVVVAKRMRISRDEARAADETGRSLGLRMLESLEMATPELAARASGETFDETYVRQVQQAVREYAARGNAFIIGRAASAILGRRADVLRVFLYAPREWRIERVVRDLGLDAKTAAAELDRIDRERRAHLKDWYGVEFGGRESFDLAIDTSSFGHDGSVAVILAALDAR